MKSFFSLLNSLAALGLLLGFGLMSAAGFVYATPTRSVALVSGLFGLGMLFAGPSSAWLQYQRLARFADQQEDLRDLKAESDNPELDETFAHEQFGKHDHEHQ